MSNTIPSTEQLPSQEESQPEIALHKFASENPKIAKQVFDLVDDAVQEIFSGQGKPRIPLAIIMNPADSEYYDNYPLSQAESPWAKFSFVATNRRIMPEIWRWDYKKASSIHKDLNMSRGEQIPKAAKTARTGYWAIRAAAKAYGMRRRDADYSFD